MCTWKVAGQDLKRSQSFTYYDTWACYFMKTPTSSTRSAPTTADPVLQLGLSILATLSWNAPILCSFWCGCSRPFCDLLPHTDVRSGHLQLRRSPRSMNFRILQHSFLRRACRVKKSVPVDIIFQELAVTRWRDFWWRRVLSFWMAMLQAETNLHL